MENTVAGKNYKGKTAWKIQEETAQGQAGKIFLHKKGPRVKYDDIGIVNNSCLCNWKCTENYEIFASLQPETIEVYENQPVTLADKTKKITGYKWQIASDYKFLKKDQKPTKGWEEVTIPGLSYSSTTFKSAASPSFYGQKTYKRSLLRMVVSSYRCREDDDYQCCGTILSDSQGQAQGDKDMQVWRWHGSKANPSDTAWKWQPEACLGCSSDWGHLPKGTVHSCVSATGYSWSPCSADCPCQVQQYDDGSKGIPAMCLVNPPANPSVKCSYFAYYQAFRNQCQWGQWSFDRKKSSWDLQGNSAGTSGGYIIASPKSANQITYICSQKKAIYYKTFDHQITDSQAQEKKPTAKPQKSKCSPCTSDQDKNNMNPTYNTSDSRGRDHRQNWPCNTPYAPRSVFDIKSIPTYDIWKYSVQKVPGSPGQGTTQYDCVPSTFQFKKTGTGGNTSNVKQKVASNLTQKDVAFFTVNTTSGSFRMLQNLGKVIYQGEDKPVYFRAVPHGQIPQSVPNNDGTSGDNLPKDQSQGHNDCRSFFICWAKCVPQSDCSSSDSKTCPKKVIIQGTCDYWAFFGFKSDKWVQDNKAIINKWQPTLSQEWDLFYITQGARGQTAKCDPLPQQPDDFNPQILYYKIQANNQCPDKVPGKSDSSQKQPFKCYKKTISYKYCSDQPLVSGGVYKDSSFKQACQWLSDTKCYKSEQCEVYVILGVDMSPDQQTSQQTQVSDCYQPDKYPDICWQNSDCKVQRYLYALWTKANPCSNQQQWTPVTNSSGSQYRVCTCNTEYKDYYFKNALQRSDASFPVQQVFSLPEKDQCVHKSWLYVSKDQDCSKQPTQPTANIQDIQMMWQAVVHQWAIVCKSDSNTGLNYLAFQQQGNGQCKTGKYNLCDQNADKPTTGWFSDQQFKQPLRTDQITVFLKDNKAYHVTYAAVDLSCQQSCSSKPQQANWLWAAQEGYDIKTPPCCNTYKYTYRLDYKVQKNGDLYSIVADGKWQSLKGQRYCQSDAENAWDTSDCKQSHTATVYFGTPQIKQDTPLPQKLRGYPKAPYIQIKKTLSVDNVQATQDQGCWSFVIPQSANWATDASLQCKPHRPCSQKTCTEFIQWSVQGLKGTQDIQWGQDCPQDNDAMCLKFTYRQTYSAGVNQDTSVCVDGQWSYDGFVCDDPAAYWDTLDVAPAHQFTYIVPFGSTICPPASPRDIRDMDHPAYPRQKWTFIRKWVVKDGLLDTQDSWKQNPQLDVTDDPSRWDNSDCAETHEYYAYTGLCQDHPQTVDQTTCPPYPFVVAKYTRTYIWKQGEGITWQNADNQQANWTLDGLACQGDLGKWQQDCQVVSYTEPGITVLPTTAPQNVPGPPTPIFKVTLRYDQQWTCQWQFTAWACNAQQSQYLSQDCQNQGYVYQYVGNIGSQYPDSCLDIPLPSRLPTWNAMYTIDYSKDCNGTGSWSQAKATCTQYKAYWKDCKAHGTSGQGECQQVAILVIQGSSRKPEDPLTPADFRLTSPCTPRAPQIQWSYTLQKVDENNVPTGQWKKGPMVCAGAQTDRYGKWDRSDCDPQFGQTYYALLACNVQPTQPPELLRAFYASFVRQWKLTRTYGCDSQGYTQDDKWQRGQQMYCMSQALTQHQKQGWQQDTNQCFETRTYIMYRDYRLTDPPDFPIQCSACNIPSTKWTYTKQYNIDGQITVSKWEAGQYRCYSAQQRKNTGWQTKDCMKDTYIQYGSCTAHKQDDPSPQGGPSGKPYYVWMMTRTYSCGQTGLQTNDTWSKEGQPTCDLASLLKQPTGWQQADCAMQHHYRAISQDGKNPPATPDTGAVVTPKVKWTYHKRIDDNQKVTGKWQKGQLMCPDSNTGWTNVDCKEGTYIQYADCNAHQQYDPQPSAPGGPEGPFYKYTGSLSRTTKHCGCSDGSNYATGRIDLSYSGATCQCKQGWDDPDTAKATHTYTLCSKVALSYTAYTPVQSAKFPSQSVDCYVKATRQYTCSPCNRPIAGSLSKSQQCSCVQNLASNQTCRQVYYVDNQGQVQQIQGAMAQLDKFYGSYNQCGTPKQSVDAHHAIKKNFQGGVQYDNKQQGFNGNDTTCYLQCTTSVTEGVKDQKNCTYDCSFSHPNSVSACSSFTVSASPSISCQDTTGHGGSSGCGHWGGCAIECHISSCSYSNVTIPVAYMFAKDALFTQGIPQVYQNIQDNLNID